MVASIFARLRTIPESFINRAASRAPKRPTTAGAKARNAVRKFSRLRRMVSQLRPDMKPSRISFSNSRRSSATGRPHSRSWYRRYTSSESDHQHRATPSDPTLTPDEAATALDQRFELGLQVALHVRAITDSPLGRLAVLEDDHGRDRHDPQLHRHRRVLVDVHLHDLDLIAQLAVELLHDRGDHPARPAPRRPEVHEHRLVGLQNGGLELAVGDFLDVCHVYSLY